MFIIFTIVKINGLRAQLPNVVAVNRRFNEIAAAWTPNEVQLQRFSLTREIYPYMHMRLHSAEAKAAISKTYELGE